MYCAQTLSVTNDCSRLKTCALCHQHDNDSEKPCASSDALVDLRDLREASNCTVNISNFQARSFIEDNALCDNLYFPTNGSIVYIQ